MEIRTEKLFKQQIAKNQHGVIAIIFGVGLTVFIGFAALAIDIGHLYVVRNELQNAADAGALAGARFLYTSDGTSINTNANQIAVNAALANRSEDESVGVESQRGHWSFATQTFTPNSATIPPNLFDRTMAELDTDANFINAVRAAVTRSSIPAFFARIFGYEGFTQKAEAVAYVGFAGDTDVIDQPIAICKQSIELNEKYSCSVGRMISSEINTEVTTGAWTNFEQEACTPDAVAEIDLGCGVSNESPITLGKLMETSDSFDYQPFDALYSCWFSATDWQKNKPWNVTLLVIDCPEDSVGACTEILGVVNINIIWMTRKAENENEDMPLTMQNVPGLSDWSAYKAVGEDTVLLEGEDRWNSFVDQFNIKNLDGTPAPWLKRSIYFLPDCTDHEPNGRNGGRNFGVLAEIPVLVH